MSQDLPLVTESKFLLRLVAGCLSSVLSRRALAPLTVQYGATSSLRKGSRCFRYETLARFGPSGRCHLGRVHTLASKEIQRWA